MYPCLGGNQFSSMKPLTKMQKKIVRIITNSDFFALTNALLRRLETLKLCDIYEYYMPTYLRKSSIPYL